MADSFAFFLGSTDGIHCLGLEMALDEMDSSQEFGLGSFGSGFYDFLTTLFTALIDDLISIQNSWLQKHRKGGLRIGLFTENRREDIEGHIHFMLR